MDIEQRLQDRINQFTELIKKEALEVIGNITVDVLPYVEKDTLFNAEIQAAEIVKAIIEGRFDWDGDYIVINTQIRDLTPRIRMEFTTGQYDALRDNIIARMPACPKDAKIASLQEDLRRAYQRSY